MKMQVSSIFLTVGGVRPATITYYDDTESYLVTSPAYAESALLPDSVSESFSSLSDCLDYCNLLVTFCDLNFRSDSEIRHITYSHIRLTVLLDDGSYVGNVDLKFDDELIFRVTVPELEVDEQFYSIESARDFLYRLEFFFDCSCSKLDTETD